MVEHQKEAIDELRTTVSRLETENAMFSASTVAQSVESIPGRLPGVRGPQIT